MRFRESRRALVPRDRLFAVVADVERYPEFLPGWERARVLGRDERGLTVEQEIGLGPVAHRFRSRATIETPERIRISSIDGPFRRLDIDWSFEEVKYGECTVRLTIDLESGGGLTGRFVESGFDPVARQLIPLFIERVRAIAGAQAGRAPLH